MLENSWKIELTERVLEELRKLDRQTHERILAYIGSLEKIENPLSRGTMLVGHRFGGHIRYRVGDYRIIAFPSRGKNELSIVDVSHRSRVYKNRSSF